MIEGLQVVTLDPGYEFRMADQLIELKDNKEKRVLLLNTATRLIEISCTHPCNTEDRNVFLCDEEKEEVRALGTALNDAGGLTLMQFCCEFCRELFMGRSDARFLEFAWDGIGEWRC